MSRIGLFIPCYIDQLYPRVGMATLELLESLGHDVEFPAAQTCCGQPMANTGCVNEARPLAERFLDIFVDYEYVVCPSGSCTAMVRQHYHELVGDDPRYETTAAKTLELCEFLVDVQKLDSLSVRFPHRVGLHNSCHGLRELRLGSSSEQMVASFNKAGQLLSLVEDLELTQLSRPDECCGFGGTFAVAEESVSCMMGNNRISDHEHAGTQVMTAGDMSCLMHLEGLLRRQGKPIHVMHIAEILAGYPLPEVSTV